MHTAYSSTMAAQLSLLGREAPSLDPAFAGLRRLDLGDGAWVDHLEAWLAGHDAVLEALRAQTRWRAERRTMYQRMVDVPRLTARLPEDGPGHPLLDEAAARLSRRYGRPLTSVNLAYYRDGSDSVAMHADRVGRHIDSSVVALLCVGEPRRFLLKPVQGGASIPFDLGWGDLLIMGGTCQRGWQHGVPKVRRAGARITAQFRHRPDWPGDE